METFPQSRNAGVLGIREMSGRIDAAVMGCL